MTTDPRECPRCKRMIEPILIDGVPCWKSHGTVVLGRGYKPCRTSLTPIKERRTKLGHQIQKAIGEHATPLPADPFDGFRD